MVLGHLVPHNWFTIFWSLWAKGPQPILSPWTNGPRKFYPHGQMVSKNSVPMDKWSPTNLVPLDKWSLEYSVCPGRQALEIGEYGGQIFGNHLSTGTKFDGDCLSRWINFLRIVCPGGQEVGYRKSGDHMGSEPNSLQLKLF